MTIAVTELGLIWNNVVAHGIGQKLRGSFGILPGWHGMANGQKPEMGKNGNRNGKRPQAGQGRKWRKNGQKMET